MRTHYLGKEQVDAYVRDLADRLLYLGYGTTKALVWCAIGRSGAELVDRILKVEPKLHANGAFVEVVAAGKTIELKGPDPAVPLDPEVDLKGADVFVVDSSLHSGRTMLRTVQRVQACGVSSITSYSLVMKRSSCFVPTLWGVTISDHDRAYFMLESVPNNRLDHNRLRGHIRLLNEGDLDAPIITSELKSFNRVTWGDRWFDMQASELAHRTYVLELGAEVIGFVTLSMKDKKTLVVDELLVANPYRGAGHSGSLMRWAETYARALRCFRVMLWAIEDKVPMYRDSFKYKEVDGGTVKVTADEETYVLMQKKVIYHIKPRLA